MTRLWCTSTILRSVWVFSHKSYVWIRLKLKRAFAFFLSFFFFFFSFFFFFFTRFWDCGYCSMNSSCKVGLFKLFSANQCTSCTVHGPTNFTCQQFFIRNGSHDLFTHLKIILLQCFSVFSCIQTDPKASFLLKIIYCCGSHIDLLQ